MTKAEHTILIVEDEAPTALALSDKLEHEGYKVIKAADGTELGVSKAELKADPIITYLALSYKF